MSRLRKNFSPFIFGDTMKQHPASFRDPDGQIFEHGGRLFRRLSAEYVPAYRHFMESGLYAELVEAQLLVSHTEHSEPDGTILLEPERIPCVSWPYEWSFGQLRDAALLTLAILEKALEHGMTLKDASAYNVTFYQGAPLFIDTSSFEFYHDGQPWQAYGQFCQHFLAPLALMAKKDLRLNRLLQTYLDGIPLDLAAALLPARTKFTVGLGIHLHAHARLCKKHEGDRQKVQARLSRRQMENLVASLKDTVQSLSLPVQQTEWGDYYNDTNYSSEQFLEKQQILREWIQECSPAVVLDLGANDGTFSRIAAERAQLVIASDIDPVAVHKNYVQLRRQKETKILPLLQDCTQPSPALGWNLEERTSFPDRMRADMGLALALVHHLAIGNNTPFSRIVPFLARLAPVWVVEFPEKDDSQVQRLLTNRKDIFKKYSQEDLESSFKGVFHIRKTRRITGTKRLLYLLEAVTGTEVE